MIKSLLKKSKTCERKMILGILSVSQDHEYSKSNLYIFPNFPSFRASVTCTPAAANGPRGLNFGMWIDLV